MAGAIVTFVGCAAIVGFGWLFYDRMIVPHQNAKRDRYARRNEDEDFTGV